MEILYFNYLKYLKGKQINIFRMKLLRKCMAYCHCISKPILTYVQYIFTN